MANNKGYSINWKTNTVSMTKRFATDAGEYGTKAYDILMDLRAKGFKIEVRKAPKRKACLTRITFEKMRKYLSRLTDAEERLLEMDTIVEAGKAQANQYEYVRQWFLLNYPNFRDANPPMNDKHQIIAPRLHLMPETKAEKTA